jgi:hypothetical protein
MAMGGVKYKNVAELKWEACLVKFYAGLLLKLLSIGKSWPFEGADGDEAVILVDGDQELRVSCILIENAAANLPSSTNHFDENFGSRAR